ncbi:hypothetical protein BDC45DRAFT_610244 [Circinella umbellata]|nr:hypothetical protein BDC45DRAFT_610244 [Circinella umbellata]
MARSLRSQGKKRFRAIKRENVFKPVEDSRLARLAEAQAKAAEKPKIGNHMEEEQSETVSMDTTDETKKISTSGARNKKVARKLAKKKAKKANKPKSLKKLL